MKPTNSKPTRLFRSTAVLAMVAAALGCTPEKKEDDRKPLITSIGAEQIESEAAVIKKAEGMKLYYADNSRDFGAFDFREPCAPTDLQTLTALEAETQKTYDSLAPDQELYRDLALDFFRKVEAQLASLKELNQLLGEFCAADFEAAKACLKHEKPLRVTINQRIAGYLPVHPHLIPNERSKVALVALELDDATGEKIGARTADVATASLDTKSPIDELSRNSSYRELAEIGACFEALDLPSAVGAHARETALRTVKLARNECLLFKAKIDAGEAVPAGERFEFCGDLMKTPEAK